MPIRPRAGAKHGNPALVRQNRDEIAAHERDVEFAPDGGPGRGSEANGARPSMTTSKTARRRVCSISRPLP